MVDRNSRLKSLSVVKSIENINEQDWNDLSNISQTASWFQTKAGYDFFLSVHSELQPFGYGVYRDNQLKGVCIGFITKQKNPIEQFFTRRAIINGGPMLADDVTAEDVTGLMTAVRLSLQQSSWKCRPIYVEIRNFNDYSAYKDAFIKAGFAYKEHLNFRISTLSQEQVLQQMDEGRRRNIRATVKAGATIVENPTLEQVQEFYVILRTLYRRKIRLPLFSSTFFKALRESFRTVFLLVLYRGRIIGGTVCVVLEGRCMYEWYVCGEDGMYDGVYTSSFATYAGLQYAVKHQLPVFDMMGAGVPDEPNGVRDFKARFGGQLVEYGRFLTIINPALYQIGKLGVKVIKTSQASKNMMGW